MRRLTTPDQLVKEDLLKTAGLFLKYILLAIGVGFLLAALVYAVTGTRTIFAFTGQWWALSLLLSISMAVPAFRFGLKFGLTFVAIHGAMYWLWFYFLPDVIRLYIANEPSFMKWWHS